MSHQSLVVIPPGALTIATEPLADTLVAAPIPISAATQRVVLGVPVTCKGSHRRDQVRR